MKTITISKEDADKIGSKEDLLELMKKKLKETKEV